MSGSAGRTLRAVVIGAGPGGLCAAIRLGEAGFRDITILEKSSGVGGPGIHDAVWRAYRARLRAV